MLGKLRNAVARLRLRAWAIRADVRCRARGGRFVMHAPHGARFDTLPVVHPLAQGQPGCGVFTLELGRDVDLGQGLILDVWAGVDGSLSLGDETRLGFAPRIQVRGGNISLGARAQIRDGAVLKVDGDLRSGADVLIGHGAVVHCTERISLGDAVTLADHVTVVDSDHGADGSSVPHMRQPLRVTPVIVEANVLLSAGVIVLRGSRIGANSVAAAGSVLAGGLYPASSLLAGSPAKVIRTLVYGDADEPAG